MGEEKETWNDEWEEGYSDDASYAALRQHILTVARQQV